MIVLLNDSPQKDENVLQRQEEYWKRKFQYTFPESLLFCDF